MDMPVLDGEKFEIILNEGNDKLGFLNSDQIFNVCESPSKLIKSLELSKLKDSISSDSEMATINPILERKIKIDDGKESREITAILVDDDGKLINDVCDFNEKTNHQEMHLDNSIVSENGMATINPILERKIKIGNGSQEMTAILVEDEDDLVEPIDEEVCQIPDSSELGFHDALDLPKLESNQDAANALNRYILSNLLFSEIEESIGEEIIMQYMEIQEPLSKLKQLLEQRLSVDLTDYIITLQDLQVLEDHKNLVDQCVQGEGTVQVNIQIKQSEKKINIVDVLKPAEEFVDIEHTDDSICSNENGIYESSTTESKPTVRWFVDANFKKEQQRLNIPVDPYKWDIIHVRHWLMWAVRQFNMTGINLQDWEINGQQLCNITLDAYRKMVPNDPGDLFWTHLELLRKCKFAAVIQKNTTDVNVVNDSIDKQPTTATAATNEKKIVKSIGSFKQKASLKISKPKTSRTTLVQETLHCGIGSGNRTGNNGQIQLWQFLLELLTDKNHRNAIQWSGNEGEFKLVNPQVVAKLWGERKNKPTMNYEKLSRALRYYYEGDMIAKVHGKRFVYKFVCDLKSLLGYSAAQLNQLVMDAERKMLLNNDKLFDNHHDDYHL